MSIAGISLSPPSATGAAASPPSSRSDLEDAHDNSELAITGFSTLEVPSQSNGAMASTLPSLSLSGFTTPTKPSSTAASRSPISKSTSKKSAAFKFAPFSLGPDATTPKEASTAGTPKSKKRVNLTSGVSIMSLARERSLSPRKTPSPRKIDFDEEPSFLGACGSTPKSPRKTPSPRKNASPRKVAFAEDASFMDAVASTPKSAMRTPSPRKGSPKKVSFADDGSPSARAPLPKAPRGLSPKSSPSKPAVCDLFVMSIASPTTTSALHDLSPTSTSGPVKQRSPIASTPSRLTDFPRAQDGDENISSTLKARHFSADRSPSKLEASLLFQSPSKVDITMNDVTMLSDYNPASSPFQTYTFATVELTDTAKELCGPFNPELFEQADFTKGLTPRRTFATPRFAQKQARVVRKQKERMRKKNPERMPIKKAILQQISESLSIDELDAATQFRVIASIGELSYALCPRKKQRVSEEADDGDAYWYDGEDNGVMNLVEARRVVRNDLFPLQMGPTVVQQRREYHASMQKYGEALIPTLGKRNYDGNPKRAYNNNLLTQSIMRPLLAFPMPDLSFQFVLEEACADARRAQGLERGKYRNVRQPIAIYGEPEVSVIQEEEEPQSPTRKLPHFPSTATHQSTASRRSKLDEGIVNIRAKLAALASVQEPLSSDPAEPLSSPIGPGFTFEVPSFISSPSTTGDVAEETDGQETPQKLPAASEQPAVASPIIYFKDRTPAKATPETAFKKRKSLPAIRRLSFAGPLRRASLPPAAVSGQLLAVQDLDDPASGSLAVAPTSVVELPVVQNPLEVDSASPADAQRSSNPPADEVSTGTASPASVVVDVRENPDIFGSFQERSSSPVQALASLAQVFEAREDARVVVERVEGRLLVRFKVAEEHASLFTSDLIASASQDIIVSPVDAPTSVSPAPAPASEENTEEKMGDDENQDEDEVVQVPSQVLTTMQSSPSQALSVAYDDTAMLRDFLSRHTAARAARAAAVPSSIPSAPIRLAGTPDRPKRQGIWADTPVLSASAERPMASPAITGRQPLGVLDTNSPSPKKPKRKADEIEEPEAMPEKPSPPKRSRKGKENVKGPEQEKPSKGASEPADKPVDKFNEKALRKPMARRGVKKAEQEAVRKAMKEPEADKEVEEEETQKATETEPEQTEAAAGPAAGVRTRAQRAAARGEAPPATKIPMRHQGYAKVRNGEKDLATLTRQNTRANKGKSLSAEEMLEQLKDAPPSTETRATTAARNGKTVQWAEKLARSQSEEPSAVDVAPLSPAEEKGVSKAAARGRPKGSAATNKRTATTKSTTTKATKSGIPSKMSQASTAGVGTKTEGGRVTKRVTAATKKAVGGSVNGTPAKRSRRIAEKK